MSKLVLIKIGSRGEAVKNWQSFLRGQQLYLHEIDGDFGKYTKDSTIVFQKLNNLHPDGIVGIKTYGAALLQNFGGVTDNSNDITSQNFPSKPNFSNISEIDKQSLFGSLEYELSPVTGNGEHITITNNFEKDNINTVIIPQLKRVHKSGRVNLHRLVEKQTLALFEEWESKNLLHLILTWEGMYNARLIRGSKTNLSCHAFGIAFDINYEWNKLGVVPALVGQKGSVRELVEIAN